MSHRHTATSSTDSGPTGTALEQRVSLALTEQIRAAIARADGRLPFDRFMELALYAPGLGYYVAGAQKLGRSGDFVTAPELSPLFGRCIATQCAEVIAALGGGDILELGAGTGALACQVLGQLERLDTLPDRYRILEPSPDLQARQQAQLGTLSPALAARCEWLSGLPRGHRGVVVANEVLDAMPVHRFQIGADGEVLEVFAADDDGRLCELVAEPSSPGLADAVHRLRREGLPLTPGYGSEINLRLSPWLAALADCVSDGLTLLIDYGYPRSAYYQADRHMGTLMCHYRQRAHADPYRLIGLQDITAHVDFTAAAEAGTAAGFELEGFTTQASFLIDCGIDQILATDASPERSLEAKQLLLPSAMGERFKVLGLSKGLAFPCRGFSTLDLSDRL